MFGAHSFGQGYFGRGPNDGDAPPSIAFRAAYRLWVAFFGPRRSIGPSPGRRTIGPIS